MPTVGIFEAKNRLSELVERVAQGEEIIITRRGEVVARLVPPSAFTTREKAAAAVEALREARKGVRLDGLSLTELVQEGRR
jgi:prevent-host-death family protein